MTTRTVFGRTTAAMAAILCSAAMACGALGGGCSVERSTETSSQGTTTRGVQPMQAAATYDADSWNQDGGIAPAAMEATPNGGIFAASNALQQAAMLQLAEVLTLGMQAGTDIYARGVSVTTPDGLTLGIDEVGSTATAPTQAYVAIVEKWVNAFAAASADVRQESLAQIEAQRALGADAITAISAGLRVLTATP